MIRFSALLLAACLACRPAESRGSGDSVTARADRAAAVCARPARGVIVGHDSIAGFSTHATLGALRKQCAAGDTGTYDAIGWQAVEWTFPFLGANVTAVQSKHGYGDVVRDDEAPDLWIVEGDSVRLLDGGLLPRTLGELRRRDRNLIVGENRPADDVAGPSVRACQFPYLLFDLSVNDTSRTIPDSARVTRVEMDTPGADTVIRRFCDRRQRRRG